MLTTRTTRRSYTVIFKPYLWKRLKNKNNDDDDDDDDDDIPMQKICLNSD
jgi:hypothetical protein